MILSRNRRIGEHHRLLVVIVHHCGSETILVILRMEIHEHSTLSLPAERTRGRTIIRWRHKRNVEVVVVGVHDVRELRRRGRLSGDVGVNERLKREVLQGADLAAAPEARTATEDVAVSRPFARGGLTAPEREVVV